MFGDDKNVLEMITSSSDKSITRNSIINDSIHNKKDESEHVNEMFVENNRHCTAISFLSSCSLLNNLGSTDTNAAATTATFATNFQ